MKDTYRHKGLRQKLIDSLKDKGIKNQDILDAMKLDKKVIAGTARLILIKSAGKGFIDSTSDKIQLVEAIKANQK